MDVVVKGHRTEVTERFRRHVEEKLAKIDQLDPKVQLVDVELSHERNPRLADQCERIEITCRSRGPVIRAEACAQDPYAALDLAWGRLEARLRRSADRRRVHHGGKTPRSVAMATAGLGVEDAGTVLAPPQALTATSEGPSSSGPGVEDVEDRWQVPDSGPMILREKIHQAVPMSLDQALEEMELVGHDFFLFVDAGSGCPSVVYRRRGYDYGVLRLQTS